MLFDAVGVSGGDNESNTAERAYDECPLSALTFAVVALNAREHAGRRSPRVRYPEYATACSLRAASGTISSDFS